MVRTVSGGNTPDGWILRGVSPQCVDPNPINCYGCSKQEPMKTRNKSVLMKHTDVSIQILLSGIWLFPL